MHVHNSVLNGVYYFILCRTERFQTIPGAFAVILAEIGLIFVFKQAENVSYRHTLKTQPIFNNIVVHIHMGCMNNKTSCLWDVVIL